MSEVVKLPRKFKAGDKVSFTDKFGIHQTGEFMAYEMSPTIYGPREVCIVLCDAFGDGPIQCIVSRESALSRAQ